MSNPVLLTVLNSMAGDQVEESFDRYVEWNLKILDLKDGLFGKTIQNLTIAEAQRIKEYADHRELEVHTLSSTLFGDDVEDGEGSFRAANFPLLDNLVEVASILMPAQIRLLMAGSSKRTDILDSSVYLEVRHPWVFDVYREAIDLVNDSGFQLVIENEVHWCLLSTPVEINGFFTKLDRAGAVSLLWDIQNLWQMGTFPSLSVYSAIKSHIGMVHLKGGRTELPGGPLLWRSDLADASWPVVSIVKAVVEDGNSPVICLNPSHGKAPSGYTPNYKSDLDFLRSEIEEVE